MTVDEFRQPAGWYPDADDPAIERWWNGSQWTSHTRPGGAPNEHADLEGQAPIAWSAADYPLATIASEPAGTAVFPTPEQRLVPSPPDPVDIPPGWYPDPQGLPARRWWDGFGWTAHSVPVAGSAAVGIHQQPGYSQVWAPYGSTTVVMMAPRKSVGVALVLTFFFGPLGMFYSTISGALIMLGVLVIGGFVAGVVTLGLAWLVWWPLVWLASMIWGCMAAAQEPAARVVNTYR